ncbi:MAG: hypothetical protein KAW12_13830 [Candidatus Aminicenantes bacterium]|nr:hypothetical protein [Candidatus Aminicenantes bacterium]
MKKISFLTIIFLLLMSISSHGLFIFNETESAFDEPDNIKALIIQGAGQFLSTYNNFISLLHALELSSNDVNELNSLLINVTVNMEKAKSSYKQLSITAYNTPYKQVVIDNIIGFDYTGFQEENQPIPLIFKKVITRLSTGNISGVYSDVYDLTSEILALLQEVDFQTNVKSNIFLLYKINQKFIEAFLIGQYVANIFNFI